MRLYVVKQNYFLQRAEESSTKKERVNLPEGKFTCYGSRDVVSYPYIYL